MDLFRLRSDQFARVGAAARAKADEFSLESVAERYLEDFASLLACTQDCVTQYDRTPA